MVTTQKGCSSFINRAKKKEGGGGGGGGADSGGKEIWIFARGGGAGCGERGKWGRLWGEGGVGPTWVSPFSSLYSAVDELQIVGVCGDNRQLPPTRNLESAVRGGGWWGKGKESSTYSPFIYYLLGAIYINNLLFEISPLISLT